MSAFDRFITSSSDPSAHVVSTVTQAQALSATEASPSPVRLIRKSACPVLTEMLPNNVLKVVFSPAV